jgi:hypothetical protein
LVEKVHPVDKDRKSEPSSLDLKVFFGAIDGPSHPKSNVKFSLEPKKHHWSWMPDAWKWPEPAPPPPPPPPTEPEPVG